MFSLIFSGLAWAGERIVDVDFQGLETVTETSARSHISSIEGSELSRQQLGEDIKNSTKPVYFKMSKCKSAA